jgi:cell division protein FtsB
MSEEHKLQYIKEADMSDRRESASSEVRAWIGVGVVIIVHTIGTVWWAATLSAEVRVLRELMVDQKGNYGLLEARVRQIERDVAVIAQRKSP